jgi:hypothetical protein
MKSESTHMLPERSHTSSINNNDHNLSESDSADDEVILERGNNRSILSTHSKTSNNNESRERKRIGNKLLLSIVSIALLLDGMLNMVIVPIIPHYLETLHNKGSNKTIVINKTEGRTTGFSSSVS